MAARAPDFSLRDPDGGTVSLAQLRGRPVVINFYKSTCPTCKQEMPRLAKVYERHRAQPVEIIGVAVGADNALVTKHFAEEAGLNFPIGLDTDKQVRLDYKLRKVPTIVFVGPDGKIANAYVGGTAKLADATDRMIKHLLGLAPAPDYAEEGGGCGP